LVLGLGDGDVDLAECRIFVQILSTHLKYISINLITSAFASTYSHFDATPVTRAADCRLRWMPVHSCRNFATRAS